MLRLRGIRADSGKSSDVICAPFSLCVLMERIPPPPRTLGNYGETVVPKQVLSSGVLKSLQHLGGVASFRASGVS